MRALLNGMLLSVIILFFAAWFLSSEILKNIKSTAYFVNNKKTAEKTQARKNNDRYSSYKRSSRQTQTCVEKHKRQKINQPFGEKLSIRELSRPFGPKLSLRKPREWGSERKIKIYQPQNEDKQTQDQQSRAFQNTDKNATSTLISGYKAYIELLNDQMKD